MNVAVRKVLVTSPLREGLLDRARREGLGHVEFVFADTLEKALAEIHDADVAWIGLWDADLLGAAKKLRWVHASTGGVSVFPEFVDAEIPFTCLKPIFGVAGAEGALAAMLMFSRRLHHVGRLRGTAERHASHDHLLHPEELAGKTLGIVGMGHMGSSLALRAGCLGLRVLATARKPRDAPPEGVHRMLPREEVTVLL